MSSITKSCSYGKSSLTCTSSLGPSNHDRWSATRFSIPFLSLISRSNSCNRRTHYISLYFASFLLIRYLMADWSLCTITLLPIKLGLNSSKAKTMANSFFFFFFSGGIVQLGIIQSLASIVDNLKYSFYFLPQHCSDRIVTGVAY